MRQNQKAKDEEIKEPKKRLERLLEYSALTIGYLYIYVYHNMLSIQVELIDFKTLIQLPIIAIVVLPLIHYIVTTSDPLQRSPAERKSIKFFQNQFPSKYILERCTRCIEDEKTCQNYIRQESNTHKRVWFDDIFHGAIQKEAPQKVRDTFEKGYNCKLLYYLSWILGIFFVLGVSTIVYHHAYLFLSGEFKLDLTPLQILSPLVAVCIILIIRTLHSPNEKKPSGCWQAWQEINGIHISWLKGHENLLVDLICQASGGTKRFKEK
jgi:hypothetical protein